MPWLRATTLALITATALAAGACTNTVVVRHGRVLELAVGEYRLAPQSVRIAAGLLTIVVHNEGRLAHNLAVSEDGQLVGETSPILPGRVAYLPIDLSPGTYVIASTLFSDQVLGAYGTLTVTS